MHLSVLSRNVEIEFQNVIIISINNIGNLIVNIVNKISCPSLFHYIIDLAFPLKDIPMPIKPIHDYNEKKVVEKIELDLKNKGGVLISDSGSPLISDPGFKLVQFCIENNIKITSIPGPSAIIPALQLSGLPINEFSFFGNRYIS